MSLSVQVKIEGAPQAVNAADKVTEALGRIEKAGEKVGEGTKRGMAEAQRAMSNLSAGFRQLEDVMNARARSSAIHAQMNNKLAQSFGLIAEQIGREKAMLQTIRGPMQQYEQDVRTLAMLHQRGAISAREYKSALAKTRADSMAPGAGGSGLSAMGIGAGAVSAAGGAIAAKGLIQVNDSAVGLRNRLRQVTGSGAELDAMLVRVGKVANDTSSNINTTGEAFVRLVQATKQMGLSQDRALKITQTLNMSLQSNGKSAAEAASGTLQLMQAMAAGALQGDEFRTIAEAMPELLDVFAKQLGVSRGELKKMGAEGKITTDIMVKALEAYAPAAQKTFEAAGKTSEQYLTRMKNRFQQWWSDGQSLDEVVRTQMASLTRELTRGAVEQAAALNETERAMVKLRAQYGGAQVAVADMTQEQAKGVLKAIEYTETGYKMSVMLAQQLTHMTNLRMEVQRLASIDPWGDQRSSFTKLKDRLQSMTKMVVDYRTQGAEAMKAYRSPLEKHTDDLKSVKDMWDQGKISADEYTKAVKFMNSEFAKTKSKGGGLQTFGHESPGFSSSQALETQMRSQVGSGGAWADAITSATSKWADGISDANIEMAMMNAYMAQVNFAAEKYRAEMESANDGIARGFNKIDDEIRDSASLTESLLVNAFHGVEDAIVNAALTGEISFSAMFKQVERDFAKLALRKVEQGALSALGIGSDAQAAQNQAAAAAMMQVSVASTTTTAAMTGVTTTAATASASLAALTAAAAAAAGALAMTAAAGGGAASGAAGIAQVRGIFGFADGGSFMVGGHGGTDSQDVRFRASPNETVTVETPEQRSGRGGGNQPVVVYLDPRAYVAAQKSPMGVQVLDDISRKNPRLFGRRR